MPASRAVGADAIRGPQLRRARPADAPFITAPFITAPFITALFIASRRAAMPWLPVLHDLEATAAFFRDVVPTRAEVWVEIGTGGEPSTHPAAGVPPFRRALDLGLPGALTQLEPRRHRVGEGPDPG